MDSAFMCKSNGFQQVVILKIKARVALNAVTSAPFTSSVLNIPVSDKSRRGQNPDLLHHKSLPQQLLSLGVVVYLNSRPRRDVAVCADKTGNSEEEFRLLLGLDLKGAVPRLCVRDLSS